MLGGMERDQPASVSDRWLDAAAAIFPRSKFVTPIPVGVVVPPAAAAAIATAVDEHALTLIVAPGGSGKTTAVAWWAAESGRWRPAWLRLDRQDDDPRTLGLALLAAIRVTSPGSGGRLAQVLAGDGASDPRRLSAALVNDLADEEQLVVVLDDLHVLVGRPTLDFLGAVIDHLPPGNRVVAATRSQPGLGIARRRVRGQIAELGAEDLRLDVQAVEAMLAAEAGAAGASAHDIVKESHGWAAAVRLAVAAAGRGRGGAPVVGDAAGTFDHRLDAFLREEVLDELPDELRSFLLETSFLVDLTAAGCEAVTGRTDAADLLDAVARRGLFVTWVETSPPTLRYHELFADFLRRRLAAERPAAAVGELRRRTAGVSSPGEAISLLLDAGDDDAAARVVCDAGRVQLATAGTHVPMEWLRRFDDRAYQRHPWLGLLAGSGEIAVGRMIEARAVIEPALATLAELGDELGARHARLALVEAHLGLGDVERADGLLRSLLEEPLPPDDHIRALLARVWFDFFAADWAAIDRGLDRAFDLAFGAASDAGRRAMAIGLALELLFNGRGPGWLESKSTILAARLGGRDTQPTAAIAVVTAGAAFLRGDLDAAHRGAARASGVSEQLGGLGWLDVGLDRLRLALALAEGDHATVDALIGRARSLVGSSAVHRQERAMYAYALARSLWARGRYAEVAEAAGQLLGAVRADDRPDTVVVEAVIGALVARHEGRTVDAERGLQNVVELHRALRFALLTGLPEIELAELHLAAGDEHGALGHAREALRPFSEWDAPGLLAQDGPHAHRALLELCAGHGVYASLARRALEMPRAASPRPLAVPGASETLTGREVEILRRVAKGESNRTIAEALFIGERTVKSHMTSLMRKLQVTSRTEAAARARDLGIA